MSSSFEFESKSQRFRITEGAGKGQFIGKAAIDSLTQKAIGLAKTDLGTIGDLLLKNKISIATWEEATAKTLKTIEISQYALGKGGIHRMTQRDYGLIGQRLKEQYKYLRGFSEDLKAGKLSEAQFRQRLNLYAADTRHAYELARTESHKGDGYNWERRIRNAKDSCVSCVGYADRGWQPIGSLPPIGTACECGSSCQCSLEYAIDKPTDGLLKSRWGMIGHGLGHDLRAG